MASSPDARVDFMISRRVSMTSFASEGEQLFFSDIFSMIVVLVRVNLAGAPICPVCFIILIVNERIVVKDKEGIYNL